MWEGNISMHKYVASVQNCADHSYWKLNKWKTQKNSYVFTITNTIRFYVPARCLVLVSPSVGISLFRTNEYENCSKFHRHWQTIKWLMMGIDKNTMYKYLREMSNGERRIKIISHCFVVKRQCFCYLSQEMWWFEFNS